MSHGVGATGPYNILGDSITVQFDGETSAVKYTFLDAGNYNLAYVSDKPGKKNVLKIPWDQSCDGRGGTLGQALLTARGSDVQAQAGNSIELHPDPYGTDNPRRIGRLARDLLPVNQLNSHAVIFSITGAQGIKMSMEGSVSAYVGRGQIC